MKRSPKMLVVFLAMTYLTFAFTIFAEDQKKIANQLVKEAQILLFETTEAPERKVFESSFLKLKKAIDLDPQNYDAFVKLAEGYRKYSVIYLSAWEERGQSLDYRNKARELIRRAISLFPDRPEAYHVLYMLLDKNKEKNEIKKVKEELCRLDPNQPDVIEWRGYDLIEEGKVAEGIALVLKSTRGDVSDVRAQKERLADVLKEKGHRKEAEKIIAGIKKERKYFEGMTAIRQNNVEKGIQLIKESVDGNLNQLPEWQKVNFADELERAQRYKEALHVYELVDQEKYKDRIKALRKKVMIQENQKKDSK